MAIQEKVRKLQVVGCVTVHLLVPVDAGYDICIINMFLVMVYKYQVLRAPSTRYQILLPRMHTHTRSSIFPWPDTETTNNCPTVQSSKTNLLFPEIAIATVDTARRESPDAWTAGTGHRTRPEEGGRRTVARGAMSERNSSHQEHTPSMI